MNPFMAAGSTYELIEHEGLRGKNRVVLKITRVEVHPIESAREEAFWRHIVAVERKAGR